MWTEAVWGGGRRRFSRCRSILPFERSIVCPPIRPNWPTSIERDPSMRRSIVPRRSDCGIAQPHLDERWWLQFAKSNFRSFETKRRSAARVLPIGLRIARDAMHHGAISDSIVVTSSRSNCADDSSQRDAANKFYEDERVGNVRASIKTWRAATENSSRCLIRNEPIPWRILIALLRVRSHCRFQTWRGVTRFDIIKTASNTIPEHKRI